MTYEEARDLFMQHEYRPHGGGYRCRCGWEGSSQAEHMADEVNRRNREDI